MLYASIYTHRAGMSEEDQARLINLFTNWKPPSGFLFKAHYTFMDGSGGMALVEADSASAVYAGTVPWLPFLEFRIVPLLEIEKAVPIAADAIGWRNSVKTERTKS